MKWLVLALLLLSVGFSTVVVNSLDGRDVVSGVYYAGVIGDKVVFVPPNYDLKIVYAKIGENGNVFLIQSSENPVIVGLQEGLENRGNKVEKYASVEPYAANLELAGKSGAKKFVLVDPVYGYNAVSVLAYAKDNGMYLLFVDKTNMGPVVQFLKGKSPQDILAYGYLDQEVKGALSDNGLTYREINTGDKFEDNLQVAELYMRQNPGKLQAILCDGNAFEDTITAGDDPVLLISQIVPQGTYDFIRQKVSEGKLKVGLVVDKDYAQTAYNLKESINGEVGSDAFSVMVKIGQGAGGGGNLSEVDFFPLRGPSIGLEIQKAEYNTVTKELEITYKDTGNAMEYVKSTAVVLVDGAQAGTVGDEIAFPVGRGELVGKKYPLNVESGEIFVNITSFYGSSSKSLERGIQVALPAGRVEFTDTSALNVSAFAEDKATGDLVVTFRDVGSSKVYFKADAVVYEGNASTKIKDDTVYSLSPNEGQAVKFPGIMKQGGRVVAGANYGSREAFLDKRAEGTYTKQPETAAAEPGIDMTLILLLVVIVLAGIVAYLLLTKKGKEEKRK